MSNKIHLNSIKFALTYDDVNIIPSFSDVESRSHCNTKTRITKKRYIDIPIVASPMDTVCGLEMCNEIARLGGLGFLHRFCSIEEQVELAKSIVYSEHLACAVGVAGDWWERTQELIKNNCNIILLDVAHGHHVNVKNAIEKIKSIYPHIDVIAGNICTRQGARDLCEWGVDGLRVGIGGGCFTPDMCVKTNIGLIPIKDINVGDKVYTHTGILKPVIYKFEFDRNEEILEINGIECTKNHEFYVIHRDDVDKIYNDDDIKKYSKWIEAQELSEDWLLVEAHV